MSDVSADPKAIPATGGPEREDGKKSAEAAFLHRLHKGACGVFGTVLGPEANEVHRDHFHFDLASPPAQRFVIRPKLAQCSVVAFCRQGVHRAHS